MATMLEKSETDVMVPTMGGNYVKHTIENAHLWRCDECGLVWEKRWYADSCPSRNHVSAFAQRYGGYVLNGKHVGGTSFTRRAVRRETVKTLDS